MSRAFDSASLQYLQADTAVVGAAPLTITAWFFHTIADQKTIVSIGRSDADHYFRLAAAANSGVIAGASAGGAAGVASTGAGETNKWQFGAAVFESSSSRYAWLNTTKAGPNTTTITPSGLNRTNIGRLFTDSGRQEWSGRIAEVAIWSAALTDPEVIALAKGASPLLVRPQALVAYWPLLGITPEPDWRGRVELTPFNNPQKGVDHPSIYRAV